MSNGSDPSLADPVRPLRIGIIGCLAARPRFAAALQDKAAFSVAGLYDCDPLLPKAWSRELDKAPVCGSVTDLLETGEAEAVIISTPSAARGDDVQSALKAGKSVLCEMPIAPSVERLDELIQLASDVGALLMPILPKRFDPYLRSVRDLILSDAIGGVRQARCEVSFPVTPARAAEAGGGEQENAWEVLVGRMALETLDVCAWWLGEISSVSADMDLPRSAPGDSGSTPPTLGQTQANLIIRHEHGQSTHHLSRSRSMKTLDRYLITGLRGAINAMLEGGDGLPGELTPTVELTLSGRTPQLYEVDFDFDTPLAAWRHWKLLRDFGQSITSGEPPIVSVLAARAAQDTLEGAFVASRDDIKVSLPLGRVK